MPAVPAKALARRSDSPGRTFSIIFAIVALLVVLTTLALIIILPKVRKKARILPGSRRPVVPKYPHPFGPPPKFPSHPALLRGFRKHTPEPIRQYDPRVESPFPSSTTELQTRSRSGQNVNHNKGLYSSTPYCFAMKPSHEDPSFQTLRAASRVAQSDPRQFTRFTGKHDYILPVPEPLVLKPRPAGRPPPLTRQLERFPMPHLHSSSRGGGLVHPVMLLQELEQQRSDTTVDSSDTPCPVPQKSKSWMLMEKSLNTEAGKQTLPRQASAESLPHDIVTSSNLTVACTTAHRLHEEHGTIASEESVTKTPRRPRADGLERMGTITRPKTPVAEIRDWFDRAASLSQKRRSSSKQLTTPASNPFTTPGVSSTPPTSPDSPEFSTKLSVLPVTPPKRDIASSCENMPRHAHRRTPSSVTLPSADKLTALPHATPTKKAHQAVGRGSQDKICKKRASTRRLKLVSWSKLRTNVQMPRRHSASSLSTILKPILGPESQYSRGASSVYSRDTKELSLLEAIDLPLKSACRSELKRADPKTPPLPRRGFGFHKASLSIDNLKTKIDNWDLHTDDLDRSMVTSSAVKRSMSDTGPRRVGRRYNAVQGLDIHVRGRPVPVNQIGRSSDDVFGIEADGFRSDRTSILIKRMAFVETSPVILGGVDRGAAPGGGEWI